jgi:hypothetical protein
MSPIYRTLTKYIADTCFNQFYFSCSITLILHQPSHISYLESVFFYETSVRVCSLTFFLTASPPQASPTSMQTTQRLRRTPTLAPRRPHEKPVGYTTTKAEPWLLPLSSLQNLAALCFLICFVIRSLDSHCHRIASNSPRLLCNESTTMIGGGSEISTPVVSIWPSIPLPSTSLCTSSLLHSLAFRMLW